MTANKPIEQLTPQQQMARLLYLLLKCDYVTFAELEEVVDIIVETNSQIGPSKMAAQMTTLAQKSTGYRYALDVVERLLATDTPAEPTEQS